MTEKELLKQLNNLKSVNPNQAWLQSNREILLAQVSNSGSDNLSNWNKFLIDLKSLVRTASQPAFALGSFLVLLLGASLFSHQAFNRIKPNDSLYIARIISEKARLNTVFNENDRDQLAMEFAAERAQDITTILSDPNFNNEEHKTEVDKLNQNFSQEMAVVKTVINKTKPVVAVVASTSDIVISAESAKDKAGVEVYENPGAQGAKIASNTDKDVVSVEATKDTGSIIDEAQKMFNNKEYNQALDKLKEVNELIKK
ncbi:MAG: hypothetical protein WC441_01340 [Patescibacteria group bacterium]